MSFYNFKRIQVVPTSADFVDIVLSKTQRKTPTVVHPNYAIARIRNFYMRKVKFSQDLFNEKLSQILSDFPKLDVCRILFEWMVFLKLLHEKILIFFFLFLFFFFLLSLKNRKSILSMPIFSTFFTTEITTNLLWAKSTLPVI
jgi:hypothetical protein